MKLKKEIKKKVMINKIPSDEAVQSVSMKQQKFEADSSNDSCELIDTDEGEEHNLDDKLTVLNR